jgi:predicted nucleic acid-binding protein
MRRVFADSSVLIAGAGSRSGASRAVLTMAEIGLFKLVVSRQILDECERNLRKKLPAALPLFAELLAIINLEIVADPPAEETAHWENFIEAKDAPILAAAVMTAPDRFLTLNPKDFTPAVAAQSGLLIQSPGEFVQEIRAIIETGL